jgi:hypothetical protein
MVLPGGRAGTEGRLPAFWHEFPALAAFGVWAIPPSLPVGVDGPAAGAAAIPYGCRFLK